jgi:phage recombination protein Bet
MNTAVATIRPEQNVGVFASLASHYNMDSTAFEHVVMQTLMPSGQAPSRAHVAAFLLVAKEHGLNPFTREIFAFPAKGAIQAVVSVDGWMKLINSHPDFDGMTFKDTMDAEGRLLSVTCSMFRKGRTHPVEVTEYMSECRRSTDTWKQWPARMLRHKAAIQAARYAFSFAGIMEPDEAERMNDPQVVAHVPPADVVGDERLDRHNAALEQYGQAVEYIKDYIGRWDVSDDPGHLQSVADAWRELPQAAQMDLWLAPTRGGVFTTHERDVIKSKLPPIEAGE